MGNAVCSSVTTVVIKLVSSLTPDDENVCAPALLQHFVSVLRQLPIAYAIRIETSDQVFQHSTPISPVANTPVRLVPVVSQGAPVPFQPD
jgi:hypothetical protein